MKDSLVFEGGGIKGLCYVGALEELEHKGKLDVRNIRNVGGTSAGAIIATLIASNHSVVEIKDILFRMDWKKLKDGNWKWYRLIKNYGLYKGDHFEKFINRILYNKLKLRNPTFRQMYVHTGRHLKMVGTNVTKGESFYMDHIHTPDMPVALGVHISACVPLLFKPVKYNDEYCIDGGVLNNLDTKMFPVDGLLVFDLVDTIGENSKASNIVEYVYRIVKAMHDKANKNDEYAVDTIKIIETKIDFKRFDLSINDKQYLVNVGRQSIK